MQEMGELELRHEQTRNRMEVTSRSEAAGSDNGRRTDGDGKQAHALQVEMLELLVKQKESEVIMLSGLVQHTQQDGDEPASGQPWVATVTPQPSTAHEAGIVMVAGDRCVLASVTCNTIFI